MQISAPQNHPHLMDIYSRQEDFFPLIGAVLQGEQDGIIYTNCSKNSQQAFVIHKFGFSQVFGEQSSDFELSIKDLVDRRSFSPVKLRLYMPVLFDQIASGIRSDFLSERQRFVLTQGMSERRWEAEDNSELSAAQSADIACLESDFGVVSRFWRSKEDFLAKSRAVVSKHKGRIVGVCYAAAIACGKAEIDIAVLREYRRRGIARSMALKFIENCHSERIQPLWDCFTNNVGSMSLCKSLGFVPKKPPYSFFTIEK